MRDKEKEYVPARVARSTSDKFITADLELRVCRAPTQDEAVEETSVQRKWTHSGSFVDKELRADLFLPFRTIKRSSPN